MDSEILTVSNAKNLPDGKRIALARSYHTFAPKEIKNFASIDKIWKAITVPGLAGPHKFYNEAKALETKLGQTHELDSLFNAHMQRREEEEDRMRLANGIYNGVDQLDRPGGSQ